MTPGLPSQSDRKHLACLLKIHGLSCGRLEVTWVHVVNIWGAKLRKAVKHGARSDAAKISANKIKEFCINDVRIASP
jgi:hypothetical protein